MTHWEPRDLTTLRVGDELSVLILPNADADDPEALVFIAVVLATELRQESGLPWCDWLSEGGQHGIIVADEDSLMGVTVEGGEFRLRLCCPSRTGWCEWLTLGAG